MFCFHNVYFLLVGLFGWGNARKHLFWYPGIGTPKWKICYRPCPVDYSVINRSDPLITYRLLKHLPTQHTAVKTLHPYTSSEIPDTATQNLTSFRSTLSSVEFTNHMTNSFSFSHWPLQPLQDCSISVSRSLTYFLIGKK